MRYSKGLMFLESVERVVKKPSHSSGIDKRSYVRICRLGQGEYLGGKPSQNICQFVGFFLYLKKRNWPFSVHRRLLLGEVTIHPSVGFLSPPTPAHHPINTTNPEYLQCSWNLIKMNLGSHKKELFYQGLCEGEEDVHAALWSAGVFLIMRKLFKLWLMYIQKHFTYTVTSMSFLSEMPANHPTMTLISVKNGNNTRMIPVSYHRQLDPKQGARVSAHRMGMDRREDEAINIKRFCDR